MPGKKSMRAKIPMSPNSRMRAKTPVSPKTPNASKTQMRAKTRSAKKNLQTILIQKTKIKLISPQLLQKQVQFITNELLNPKSKIKPHAREQFMQAESLTVVLVGQTQGRQLNLQFRGRDYATDVLSFAPSKPSSLPITPGSLPIALGNFPVEPGNLGELVFCVPVIKKQAQEHKLTVEEEFFYLLIHGVLHLLGYDHEKNDKGAAQMYRLQDGIFDIFRSKLKTKNRVKNGDRNRTVRRKK